VEFSGNEKWGATQSFRGAGPRATATADEIIEHVRGQIARYKVPDYIDFVAELPKTFTGKIQK
jgi:fatty-acyl-CoA synthase